MKVADFIREHTACREGADWALSISDDMSAVWDALVDQGKHEWLLWTATRPGAFSDTVLRKLACRFVRETPLVDGRTVWDLLDNDRSRLAVEVAEAYADGKATEVELDAAYAAACTTSFSPDTAAYASSFVPDTASYAERATYFAAVAAASAACAAAWAFWDVLTVWAADAAADAAAYAAAADAAESICDAAYAAARAVSEAAKSAQVQMIAELGNPFKKEPSNENR